MGKAFGKAIACHFVTQSALPPNMGMELTVPNVTVLAREEQGQRHLALQLIPGC